MMDPDFWHSRWHNNEIGFHQPQFNAHLQAFWNRLQAQPECEVFVPLCGKSLDMRWLQAQGHGVLGVELSPLAVAAYFEEQGLSPELGDCAGFQRYQHGRTRLLVGDFFQLRPEQLASVGAVYDRASLIALPPAMRPRYAQHLHALLPAGVPILLVTMDYPSGVMEGPPFAVLPAEVDRLYGADYDIKQLYEKDILPENPRFARPGLEQLMERVYLLAPHKT